MNISIESITGSTVLFYYITERCKFIFFALFHSSNLAIFTNLYNLIKHKPTDTKSKSMKMIFISHRKLIKIILLREVFME